MFLIDQDTKNIMEEETIPNLWFTTKSKLIDTNDLNVLNFHLLALTLIIFI